MRGTLVACRDCDWEGAFPTREAAVHAKRVHEQWYDHVVVLEPRGDG